jgi:hypothetical protein
MNLRLFCILCSLGPFSRSHIKPLVCLNLITLNRGTSLDVHEPVVFSRFNVLNIKSTPEAALFH